MNQLVKRSLVAASVLVFGVSTAACNSAPDSPQSAEPASGSTPASATAVRSGEPPKHIVLVVIDGLRADYGARAVKEPVATPTLDALGAKGASANRAYASHHQTTASLAALFTGRTPSIEGRHRARPLRWNEKVWCGQARLGTGKENSVCVADSVPTLAERLSGAGYKTVGIASYDATFRPAGFDRGFDVWKEVGAIGERRPSTPVVEHTRAQVEGRSSEHVIDAAFAALDAAGASGSGKLFLYVHFMDVQDWYVSGDSSRSPLKFANYPAAVETFDTALARFLDGLRERDLLTDALLVVTSDHGAWLRDPHPMQPLKAHFGNPSFDEVLRVPLIVQPKAWLPDADRLWRSEDVHRMLLGAAGVKNPGTSELADDEIFVSEQKYQTLKRGDWKYIRSRTLPVSMLFNTADDPGETLNREPTQPELTAKLEARIDELVEKLGADPRTGSRRDIR